jgi:hypothetical protein
MRDFWDIAPCLHNHPDDEGSTHLWNMVYCNDTTRRYISEGSHLHARRRENLKSHKQNCLLYGMRNIFDAGLWYFVQHLEFYK